MIRLNILVFKQAVIHYPKDTIVLQKLYHEIADFRFEMVMQQLGLLDLSGEERNELSKVIFSNKHYKA